MWDVGGHGFIISPCFVLLISYTWDEGASIETIFRGKEDFANIEDEQKYANISAGVLAACANLTYKA